MQRRSAHRIDAAPEGAWAAASQGAPARASGPGARSNARGGLEAAALKGR
jgi:hypothetical protein